MCDERTHGSRFVAGCCDFTPQDIAKMKHMAGRFMKNFMGHFGDFIPYNVEDLGTQYLITIPLPGRTKEQVNVSVINKIVNVTANKPDIPEYENKTENKKDKDTSFPGVGFRFIDVNMDIPLPSDADENSISSKLANGLLRIMADKKTATNIDIKEETNN